MIVNIVKKIFPTTIKRRLKTIKQRMDYQALRPVNCNLHNLRILDNEEYKIIFNSGYIIKDWKIEEDRIESLELPDFTGGINKGDQRAIYYLVKYLKPNSILEIGTHIGCSTIHFALAMKDFGNLKKLVTVDIKDVNDNNEKPWNNFDSKFSPKQLIDKINADEYVSFHVENSYNYLQNCNEKYDFIFLDGDHSVKTVYQEIPLALELLNPEGIILLHDYFPNNKPLWSNNIVIPGPYLATQKLIEENPDLLILPIGILPWKTKFSSNITSLAMLTKRK